MSAELKTNQIHFALLSPHSSLLVTHYVPSSPKSRNEAIALASGSGYNKNPP